MKPISAYLLRLMLAAAALTLVACAGTKVKDVQSTSNTTAGFSPHTIAIVVENNSPPPSKVSRRAAQLEDAKLVVTTLTDHLGKVLAGRGLVVVSTDAHPDLTLRCSVLDVRGGNEWLRVLIGYGAGRAELRTKVTLLGSTGTTQPLVTFDTESTTGKMPGAGFGLASGQALAAGGAALSVPGAMRQGLGLEVNDSVEHIDNELGKYFKSQHWQYSTGNAATVDASRTTSSPDAVPIQR
ncbi:MAG: DUF4410 domain-containing protein [Paraburkholderia sp.]|uniref:DUF4410 domain-containing protein n=1 Tax=Burkholderiaceae TaxID=119060 RepID=UPI0010FA491A|nr:DUF4410 domain-containing protein [Burkholderia sp. 4M9327F10]